MENVALVPPPFSHGVFEPWLHEVLSCRQLYQGWRTTPAYLGSVRCYASFECSWLVENELCASTI
jgi:hypothetical protein